MCGIVGLVAKNQWGFNGWDDDLFEEMIYADGLRGMDSTGAFMVTNRNQIFTVKQATEPGIFLKTKAWKDLKQDIIKKGMMLVGHNRKATSGSITTANAHPFQKDGVVLVHNGYISNSRVIDKDVSVDSEAIVTALLANRDDPVKALQSLSGAWAVVWYDHKKKKLFLGRNAERPLTVSHEKDKLIFASEPTMIQWLMHRRGQLVDTPKLIPANTIYEVTLNPFQIKTHEIKAAPVVVSSFPHRSAVDSARAFLEGDACGLFGVDQDVINEARAFEEGPPEKSIPDGRGKALGVVQDKEVVDGARRALQFYPTSSTVLFEPAGLHELDNGKMRQIEGTIWRPGKPPYPAVWNLPSYINEDNFLKDETPLRAKVDALSRRNNVITFILTDVQLGMKLGKDAVGVAIETMEWTDICKSLGCDRCAKEIDKIQPDFTLLNRRGGEYSIICAACMAKAIKSTRKESDGETPDPVG